MNPLVYHIVSGQAFFSGIVFLLTTLVTSRFQKSRMTVILFSIGLLFIILSSTPLPIWIVSILVVVTFAWILSRRRPSRRRMMDVLMLTAWLLVAAMELRWHLMPRIPLEHSRSLTVIGDSVSAGMGENEAETWPSLLSSQHGVTVQDLSHVGETARSASRRVQQSGIASPMVLVEIGGNDILGSTSPEQFAQHLDALLTLLKSDERTVIMFELPLPPFFHHYAHLQRTLATQHGVILIPKRIFLDIISDGSSTLDSIHLSQQGHQKMSDLVWIMVFDESTRN